LNSGKVKTSLALRSSFLLNSREMQLSPQEKIKKSLACVTRDRDVVFRVGKKMLFRKTKLRQY
jgi:hypothetical protein